MALRVLKELAPLVLMVLKVFKAHLDSPVSKDLKEILEIKAVLVTLAPLGQKGPLETRGLLAHQVPLEIQVKKKMTTVNWIKVILYITKKMKYVATYYVLFQKISILPSWEALPHL